MTVTLYIGAAEWFGALAGRAFGDALIFGWRAWTLQAATRTTVTAFCACLALSPILVPAQMTPQQIERSISRFERRIEALEDNQKEIAHTIRRMNNQSAKLDDLNTKVAVLADRMEERDKFLAWLLGIINSAAVLTAGISWMIRHRKPSH